MVAVRVEVVVPSGYSIDCATIRQKKTGRLVRLELTDQTRQDIDDKLRLTGRKLGQFRRIASRIGRNVEDFLAATLLATILIWWCKRVRNPVGPDVDGYKLQDRRGRRLKNGDH